MIWRIWGKEVMQRSIIFKYFTIYLALVLLSIAVLGAGIMAFATMYFKDENYQQLEVCAQKGSWQITQLLDENTVLDQDLVTDYLSVMASSVSGELLLSDLDFTLAAKRTRRPDQPLRDWIAALQTAGIDFMIVSNNRSGSRVTEFCADLGVPYQGHAGKPSPRGLEAAMRRAGADRAHTAMLGDKLLTDMLAANRAGVLPLMVEPVGGAVTAWQKVLHALQAPFKAACRRKMEKKS